MRLHSHHLELLSPARDAAIAREAILHGADAVYIGGPGFGARHNASNSLRDIAELVPFAHRFGAKVFVTLNTILHDDELEPAQRLITDLYQAGVDVHRDDELGYLSLSDSGVRQRDAMVFDSALRHGLPITAVPGGGYRRDWQQLIPLHLSLFEVARHRFG